jgi:alpha-ribazole phosphatase
MIKIRLIRHGKTAGNSCGRYIGVTDEPLCQEGLEYIKTLDYPMPQRVYTSAMKRCVQTAQILFPGQRLHILEDLNECDFGAFENKNYLELAQDPRYQAWIDSNGMLPFPEGESREECKNRNRKGFLYAVDACIKNGITDVAFVIHGGTIMNIMEEYAVPHKEFYDWHLGNGACYQTELDPVLWQKSGKKLILLADDNTAEE